MNNENRSVKMKAIPLKEISQLVNDAMNACAANGANSVSMPEEHVRVAHFVCYPDEYALLANVCRDDGRCQYAIDHAAEGLGHCPADKCCMPKKVPALETYQDQVLALMREHGPLGYKFPTHGELKAPSYSPLKRGFMQALFDRMFPWTYSGNIRTHKITGKRQKYVQDIYSGVWVNLEE